MMEEEEGCDRCGAQKWFERISSEEWLAENWQSRYYHLCEGCFASLKRWFSRPTGIDELDALPKGVRDWLIDMLQTIRTDLLTAERDLTVSPADIDGAGTKVVIARTNAESMLTDLRVSLDDETRKNGLPI